MKTTTDLSSFRFSMLAPLLGLLLAATANAPGVTDLVAAPLLANAATVLMFLRVKYQLHITLRFL